MITIIIPTLNSEESLAATMSALVPGAVDGIVRDVVVVDGGSRDQTMAIVEASGAQIVNAARGRGSQLAAGVAEARSDWYLFLHADTVLERGWEQEVRAYIERVGAGARPLSAAAFRFALDDIGFLPRLLEWMVGLRCLLFRLPYGDQGLLIPKQLYQGTGGYRALPLMEDVDLVRRIGRRRIVMLRSQAVTSAVRFRRDGYVLRSARNLVCLALYYLRIPPRYIVRIYD